jgi:hypothetical protein
MSVRGIAAAACGLASAAMALLVPLVGAYGEPRYSQRAQFISELGAADAANARLVAVFGFVPIGALVLAFVVLMAGVFPRSRRTSLGLFGLAAVGTAYLVSALFPCDAGCPSEGSFSQSVHNLFGLLEYVGALSGLLLLANALRSSAEWRSLGGPSIACAALIAVGFFAMLTPALQPMRGASQRIAEAAIFGWVAYTSLRLLRVRREGEPPCEPSGKR